MAVDYLEVTVTTPSIAGGGGVRDEEIAITNIPAGSAIARIHEIVLDSASDDFDIAIFEAAARTTLDRVVFVENINLHTVQLLGAGRGSQYRDRDVALATDTADFHARFTNNQVGAATITLRIRYSLFFMR